MALQAGRVGVAKDQVDEFGKIVGGGGQPSGDYYTKQQTDNKFETKTHASNTYQTKLDIREGSLTLGSGVSIHTGTGNKIVRCGNVVTLCATLDVTSATAWNTVLATVPEGFRPSYRMRFLVTKGLDVHAIDITTDGNIVPSGNLSNVELWISISWVVED